MWKNVWSEYQDLVQTAALKGSLFFHLRVVASRQVLTCCPLSFPRFRMCTRFAPCRDLETNQRWSVALLPRATPSLSAHDGGCTRRRTIKVSSHRCRKRRSLPRVLFVGDFHAHLRHQRMGKGSGAGSVPAHCYEWITFLRRFIRQEGLRSVADLGCGDWQFSPYIYHDLHVHYVGYDIVSSVVEDTL